jgi:hypothetical protein
MSLLVNSTNYNPLYLEDATGLDADFDEAVLMDDAEAMLAKKRARKGRAIFDDFDEEVDYA